MQVRNRLSGIRVPVFLTMPHPNKTNSYTSNYPLLVSFVLVVALIDGMFRSREHFPKPQ